MLTRQRSPALVAPQPVGAAGTDDERAAPDEVVQTLATTAADALFPPLTVLLVTLDRWRAGDFAPEAAPAVQERLEQASRELARRITLFARARRYTPRRKAGFLVLDLDAAQAPGRDPT
jgi:hypothetical protein